MNEIYAPMPEQCGSPLNSKYSDQQMRTYADDTCALREAQRKPLTDEQREEIAKGWRGRNWTLGQPDRG